MNNKWNASGARKGMAMQSLRNMFCCVSPKLDTFLYEVDLDEVDRVKAQFSNGTDFVDADDVLTSWFGQSHDCTNLKVSVNLRDRLPSIKSHHAGSYNGAVLYGKGEFKTPLEVRNHFTKVMQPGFNWNAPSMGQYSQGMSVHADWSQYYNELIVPGWSQTVHLPMLCVNDYIHGRIFPKAVMLTFAPRKGEVAAWIWQSDGLKEEKLEADKLFKKKLMQ